MSPALFLADTSALVRLMRDADDAYGWRPSVRNGLIGICQLTELELLFSARSAVDRENIVEALHDSLPDVFIPDRVYDRAWEVQSQLTRIGKHRGPGPVDLVVAAVAELSDLTLLHYDNDFDTIAEVTGQPMQRLRELKP